MKIECMSVDVYCEKNKQTEWSTVKSQKKIKEIENEDNKISADRSVEVKQEEWKNKLY